MGEGQAAFSHHLGEIAQTELVAHPPHHDEQDDVRGILQEVKGGASPFIEKSLTDLTTKLSIP